MFYERRSLRSTLPALGLVAIATAGACGQEDGKNGLSAEEWAMVQEIAPYSKPMPANPFNHRDQDVAVAKLGQMLFFETDVSEAEPLTVDSPFGKKGDKAKIGCVTCHDPARYFADARPGSLSLGRNGYLRRNTPTMLNAGYYNWAGWTGRHDSLVMHGAGVWSTSASALSYAHYVYRKYRDEYNAVFPATPLDPALDPLAPDAARFPMSGAPKANAMAADGPWEKMAPEDQKIIQQIQYNLGRIWDTYPRKLTTPNSPFERFTKGDEKALTPEAKRGLRLFIGKAACSDCHSGPTLSDNQFHNIGVATNMLATAADVGRFADLAASSTNVFGGAGQFSDDPAAAAAKNATVVQMDMTMMGAFRTPGLLSIEKTGPYFHSGEFPTLESVVRFYNVGGGDKAGDGGPGTYAGTKDVRLRPLGLTEPEIADLVAFLKSLTGDLPPLEWTQDTAKH
ncbi:MAG: cytochrome c peroxidase [Deltaproteobacteria bacterium]|nr:cytochrome c peroxidase [Deltaproteobacteria bacterium]